MRWTIILAATMFVGCATVEPWEAARPGCLEHANAACKAAIDAGYASGIVICTLPGTYERHAVTWIEKDGRTIYYDAAFGFERTNLGRVHRKTRGPTVGVLYSVGLGTTAMTAGKAKGAGPS